MEEILFNTNYISGKAKDLVYDFSNNKFIKKTTPGIGMTRAILDYIDGNILLIVPYQSIILKKQQNDEIYKSDKRFYRCGAIDNDWDEVTNYLNGVDADNQNLIICTTPDSICSLIDSDDFRHQNLVEQLKNMPVVVDEYDAIIRASTPNLRPNCGRFLEILFSDWNANYTITTATPNRLDIDLNIPYYTIGRRENKLIKLNYSKDYSDFDFFVQNEIQLGNKIAIFSNRKNVHINKNIKNKLSLVGDNLGLKLEPYSVDKSTDIIENPFENHQVVIFSSRYFIGYDILDDVSVVIVSQATSPATLIGVNSIIQSLFRCRGELQNCLFINSNLIDGYNVNNKIENIKYNFSNDVIYYQNKATKLSSFHFLQKDEPITKELKCNRSMLLSKQLEITDKIELHDDEYLKEKLKEFNVELVNYKSPEKLYPKPKGTGISERLINLINLPTYQLKDGYFTMKPLINQGTGSFSYSIVLERLTAFLIKKLDCDFLNNKLNKNLQPYKLYESLNKIIQKNFELPYLADYLKQSNKTLEQIPSINCIKDIDIHLIRDWYLLYIVYLIKKNSNVLPDSINNQLFIYKVATYNFVKQFESDKKNRITKSIRKFKRELKKIKKDFSDFDEGELRKYFKKLFTEKKNIKKDVKQNKIIKSLLLLYNYEENKYTKGFREYNPLTALKKEYRIVLPFTYISIDLKSANAQFIDKLIGSNKSDTIYDNIKKKLNISRKEAKTKFNSVLNNHYKSTNDLIDFFNTVCGYSMSETNKIIELNPNRNKGEMFRLMTLIESQIITSIKRELEIKNAIRLHDSLIVANWDIKKEISESIFNYNLNIEYFRDGSSIN